MSVGSVPVVTLDGPGGSGKGTICQMLAKHFGWHLLDSGSLYRLAGLNAVRLGLLIPYEDVDFPASQIDQITDATTEMQIDFVAGETDLKILLAGDDVTHEIRLSDASFAASKVSSLQPVRDALHDLQLSFAKSPGLFADGRDMGTVIFPEAPLKVYLTASSLVRAQRRYHQLEKADKLNGVTLEQLQSEIEARDHRDSTRSISPMVPADDAVIIDSSELSVTQVYDQIVALMNERSIA